MEYATGLAGAREDFSRYLSACYYQPAPEFGEERLFDSLAAAATTIDPELAETARRLGQLFGKTDLETLLVDYTQLFIGPSQPAAMPYASFWLTRDPAERPAATEAVLAYYAEGGFDISEDFREFPDHVAAELEFLYLLIFSLNRSKNEEPLGDFGKLLILYRCFLETHLGAWIPDFAAAVDSSAQTEFYRLLARMTARFIGKTGATIDPYGV